MPSREEETERVDELCAELDMKENEVYNLRKNLADMTKRYERANGNARKQYERAEALVQDLRRVNELITVLEYTVRLRNGALDLNAGLIAEKDAKIAELEG